MRNTYLVIVLALFAFGSSAQAADMPNPQVQLHYVRPVQPPRPAVRMVKPNCDKCDLYKTAPRSNPWPTATRLVCIYFVQAKPDAVDLLLYRADGSRIAIPGHDSHKVPRDMSPKENRFCIGVHWLADAAVVELCNGAKTARIHGYLIPQMRQTGEYHACLLGSACPKRG